MIEALAEGGFPTFTLRSLAKRMGGSSTLITHYFPNRDALIGALLESVLSEADKKRGELLQIGEPHERLHAVLEYFLPDDPETLALERVRVALVAHRDAEPALRKFFDKLEPGMRGVMRAALEEFVDAEELNGMVDVLRAWTSGIALSAVEHPEIWTPERQRAALERFVSSLALPLAATSQKADKRASSRRALNGVRRNAKAR
jgi:AcrR family transcriptional regulator